MKSKIIVTGGSGMVGRFLKEIMPEATYLSSKDYNLTAEKDVVKMYFKHKPDIVIHLAAKVGGIIDNINKPAEYFTDNVLMNTNLVDYAYRYDVKRFIGILSTCIYPDEVKNYPMSENDLHIGPPTSTNFSYGYAKRALAVQIDAYNKQYGTKYNYIIPCNLYGEYDKHGENSHFVAALIKKIIDAKKENRKSIELFGTGNPLRQFMHAEDFAKIIKLIIDNDCCENFNVATLENYSINEIATIALKACDAENLEIKYDFNKPDGQFRKDVSIEKFEGLFPKFQFTNLYDGIKKTYNFMISKYE
jgi:GDP-L-fucose synthase